MRPKQPAPGVYTIPLGVVNAYLIDDGDLTLVDTGIPGSADKILGAVRSLGRQPGDIRQIVVTHCHADHSGSLAALKAATGAPAYMHPADAALVRAGQASRRMQPAPGLLPALMFRLVVRSAPHTIEPAEVEHEVCDGDTLPFAGGLRAVHAPGHCAGQLALLYPRHGGVLVAADAASNMLGRLGPSIFYEDLAEGTHSLQRLATLDFAIACFGHGRPITGDASARFRRRWPTKSGVTQGRAP